MMYRYLIDWILADNLGFMVNCWNVKKVCKYDWNCLEIWLKLPANMTEIVSKYDQNCLHISIISILLLVFRDFCKTTRQTYRLTTNNNSHKDNRQTDRKTDNPPYFFFPFCWVAPLGGVTGLLLFRPPYGNFFLSAGWNCAKHEKHCKPLKLNKLRPW